MAGHNTVTCPLCGAPCDEQSVLNACSYIYTPSEPPFAAQTIAELREGVKGLQTMLAAADKEIRSRQKRADECCDLFIKNADLAAGYRTRSERLEKENRELKTLARDMAEGVNLAVNFLLSLKHARLASWESTKDLQLLLAQPQVRALLEKNDGAA